MDERHTSLLGAYAAWFLSSDRRREDSRGPKGEASGTDAWKAQARRALESSLLSPEAGHPEVRILRSGVRDGLHVEELAWKLPWGPETRAYFMRPAGAKGPLPGVLALHDHGGNKFLGKRKIADGFHDSADMLDTAAALDMARDLRARCYGGRAWANELAGRGFAVLAHDAFMFESRRLSTSDLPTQALDRTLCDPRDLREPEPGHSGSRSAAGAGIPDDLSSADAIRLYNAFASAYESTIAKAVFCSGFTWPGITAAEDRFALSYLAERPEVDPGRLGCCGLSGGGLRANYLAALDERIRCSVTAGFMTTWEDFASRTAYMHTWMIYPPGLPRVMEYAEILGLHAPAPALVQACLDDPLFTLDEVRKAENTLKAAYSRAGAGQVFRMSYYEGGHKFDSPMQDEAFSWLERWLR